jgi:hypothetical protein
VSRRLIKRDPHRGIDIYVDVDADGGFVFSQVQRTRSFQTFVNETRAEANRTKTRRKRTQDHVQHVAEIPLIVVNRLMAEGIWGDQERMKKWLNDPSHRDFRTGGGTL